MFSSWIRSAKRRHYYILSLSERLRRLTYADAEIGLGNLRQGGESGLPLLLLSLKLILEVGCQRLVPQCRHEDALRTFCRCGYHGIRQLVDVSKQSCLQKSVYHFVSTKTIYIFLAEIGCLCLVAPPSERKEHSRCLARNLFTPGLFIFLAYFCFFYLGDFNLRATVTDEFTHWMYCIKTTTYLNDFSTNPAAYSAYPSYPPGMCLFQYFFQKIYLLTKPGMPFSEWRAYLAYQVLLVSLGMPFLQRLSFKRPLEMLLNASIPIFIHLPFFFGYNFAGVMIDAFVGAAAGYSFAMVLQYIPLYI